jgi:oxalate---CoA ligase
LVALVERVAHQSPGAAALLAPGRVIGTYRHLCDQVAAVGAALSAAGIERTDRVAVALHSGPEMAAAFFGIAGVATCAPLNPAYTNDEATFSLSDLDARALIVAAEDDVAARDAAGALGVPCFELAVEPGAPAGTFGIGALPAAGDGPASPAPDDVALVLHTSGTTARPKQVPLTHANLCASAGNVATTLRLTGTDRCLNAMPLFHIHGLVAALAASMASGASVICPGAFDPERFLTWLVEGEATWYTAVPTVHQAVLTAAASDPETAAGSRLRLIRSSSAPLPPQVMAALEARFGVPVVEAYGMTEAAHQMTSNPLPPAPRRPGTVGLPAGPEVAVVDAGGGRLGSGEVGEIVIRGPNVISGYVANPEADAGAFVDGWFRTGDQGVFDPDGYLTITGRLKELINRGGEKVAPREVDEALLNHPSVGRAVAFAVPHPTLGEDVAAAVVAAPGATVDPEELRHFVAARLSAYKVPRRVVVVDDLPVGATGKPTRIGLAERLGLDSPAVPLSGGEPAHSPLEVAVAALWSQLLGVEEVPVDEDFVTLGGDSLSAVQLLARVQDAFAIEIAIEQFLDEGATVRRMAALIERVRLECAPRDSNPEPAD